MADELITVDQIDNIRVNGEVHHNQLSVLRSLSIGMSHLAELTRLREIEALEEYGKDRVTFITNFGNDLEMFLGCVFDWFSVSLVSYLRTIKLMHMMESKGWNLADLQEQAVQRVLRTACEKYVNDVAPEVFEWRNKIAAHRSATDPRSDSLAIITYSTFPTVGYKSPYYGVGHLKLALGDGSSSNLPEWYLTETFERLTPRYWPGQELSKLDW